MGRKATLLGTLVVAVAGGLGGAAAYDEFIKSDGDATVVQQAPLSASSQPSNESTGDGALTPAEIYEKTSPGVVLVNALVTEQVDSPFGQQEQQGESTGTGFVVSKDGFIVTNAHVVQGAKEATVQFGADKAIDAKVQGIDVNSDLAVLKVDPDAHDLEPLDLGTAKRLKVGDPVVAIGNPYGLDRTLTTGVVSALARKIDGLNGFKITNVIQTDAAINKGNSGGPLLDAQGKVIGVNSQIQTENGGNVGIGFAVPVDKVEQVLPTLKAGKEVQVAFLGVTTVPIDKKIAKVVKIGKGLLVVSVKEGSPADKSGLKAGDSGVTFELGGGSVDLGGDVIVSVDGETFATAEELATYIGGKKVGDTVKVDYEREGDRKSVDVKLGNRPTTVTAP
ncbi:MAG: trypsin-like peptidase domain-containing protein [Solirubrobacteraceae bacterium]|nr:trypsin-like peptidase domain-containing protein [Solirubrobacteraceae bacterium]